MDKTQLPATADSLHMAALLRELGHSPTIHLQGTDCEHIIVGRLMVYWDRQSGVEPGWCWRIEEDDSAEGSSLDSVAELERLLMGQREVTHHCDECGGPVDADGERDCGHDDAEIVSVLGS